MDGFMPSPSLFIYWLICFKNSFTTMFILCARRWAHTYNTAVGLVLIVITFKSARQILIKSPYPHTYIVVRF